MLFDGLIRTKDINIFCFLMSFMPPMVICSQKETDEGFEHTSRS